MKKGKRVESEREPMSVEMYHKGGKNLDLNPKLQIILQRVFNVVIGIFLKFCQKYDQKAH
jgi:hypothetical protein